MTLKEARAKLGLPDAISDKLVRAAAEEAGIEIKDEERDERAEAAALVEELRKFREGIKLDSERVGDEQGRAQADLERRVTEALERLGGEPMERASQKRREPQTAVFDRFDQLDYDGSLSTPHLSKEQRDANRRANLELAMMIMGGTRELSSVPTVQVPEDLKRAWQSHVFADPTRVPWVTDGKGTAIRAMDTAETGFGLELIGAQYVTSLWEAARNTDGLVGRIREIPMTAATTTVPIDGDLPEMLFVGESTADAATAYTASNTGSNQRVLTARKFTIQEIWSGELEEDSIIAFTPFLRDKLNMAAGLYLGSSYYNGDTTNAGTGNINSDDADPTDTKHYLAYDGIRHYWLVDATGQGKDMGNAALDPLEIVRARGKLNGGDDDVDNLIKNINWGTNARELLAVVDWDTYMNLLELDVVKTVDQYGSQATVVTGELGAYSGIPIISPSYASKTEADGKASTTEASNTRGQITILNPRGFLAGRRREMQLFFDRIQRTDQFLFELYTRRGFNRFGGNVSAGVYNIAVS